MGIYEASLRAIANTSITMEEPVIVRGKPYDPYLLATGGAEYTTSDAWTGQYDEDDPDSVYVWKVNSLADPGNGEYLLDEWPEVGGGPSWISSGDYRPGVTKRVDFRRNGREKIHQTSVHFGRKPHQHMWIDLGREYESMTVIMAVMFNGFDVGHHVLDAGTETPVYANANKTHKWKEGIPYRATILYGKSRFVVSTSDNEDPDAGKHLQGRHGHSHRPRVVYAVFNGNQSKAGFIAERRVVRREGKLEPAGIRHLVLGRAQNHIGRKYSTNMTVLEVRVYDTALSWKKINRRAKKLKGRYDMNDYEN